MLDLSNNKITEIKGLKNLINLKELNLNNNKFINIKGFENLINLERLSLGIRMVSVDPHGKPRTKGEKFVHGVGTIILGALGQGSLISFKKKLSF
ncbi:MAG: leucine-rich repeat domain-containing protein [Promethearchaeota archaeon]